MKRILSLGGGVVIALMLCGAFVAPPLFAAATFDPALQPTGYVTTPALSKYDLSSGNETSFQATFDKQYWYGNLFAYPISDAGIVEYAAERWGDGAGGHIDAQNYDTGRKIVTMNGSAKVPFRSGSISSPAAAIIDYVRGDRSNEKPNGSNYRARKSVLGDIIHSRPYMVDGLIYVGANDGMVHVINVNNATATAAGVEPGGEVWAYVPSMLLSKLSKLTVDSYVHTYFVDGSMSYNIVSIAGNAKRILVGSLGAGGKGIYALDITSPVPSSEADAANKILWEVSNTSTGFANLGYTYGLPVITRVHNGTGISVPAVIMSNGYLNTGNGQSSLFIIDLATGSLIKEIPTGIGSLASPNGLSSPTVLDTDSDGVADYVFAGDLDGYLWKFNLQTDLPSSWTKSALISVGQPITSTTPVVPHPSGGYMINFATGKMLTSDDTTDTGTFYAYGIWWDSAIADPATPINDTAHNSTKIVSQVLTRGDYGTTPVRTATVNPPDWTTHVGWRTPFPLAGERVVGDGAFITSGRYYFMTHNPTVTRTFPSPSGDSWLLELGTLNGGGALGPFLDLSGDFKLTDADRLSSGGVAIDGAPGVPVGKYAREGVISQPVLVELAVLNTVIFNHHPDLTLPPVTEDRGVAGGHFDVDIFYPDLTCSDNMVVDGTYTCDGRPNNCRNYSDPTYTVPSGYTESCTVEDQGTIEKLCAPGQSTCNSELGYTLPPRGSGTETQICADTTLNGASNSCSGNHKSPDSCASYSTIPYTVPAGSYDSCTSSSTTVTKTCSGQHVSDTCSNFSSPTYNTSETQTCTSTTTTLDTSATALASYVCNGNRTTCKNRTSTPNNYSSIPVGQGEVCTYAGGPNKTTCKFYPYNYQTTCTYPLWTTNCTIKTDKRKCTYTDYLSTCVVKRPITNCIPGSWSSANNVHFHQYDDIFDVTGVNMLNPSSASINLNKVIKNDILKFKVLVANQAFSPALQLSVGGPIPDYPLATAYDNQAVIDTLGNATSKTYTMDENSIKTLKINLPIDAFVPKIWPGGDGVERAGLIPTDAGCVMDPINNPGILGTRRNGALNLQIIKYDTPASAIELNVAGRTDLGYRVKEGPTTAKKYSEYLNKYMLAEYSFYWHHPNDICTDKSGWDPTPPADPSKLAASSIRTPLVGSDDPKIGSFKNNTSGTGSVVTTVVDNVTTTTTTYTDNKIMVVTRTHNSDNTYTIVTTYDGQTETITTPNLLGGIDRIGEEAGGAGSGRISWRQLLGL